MHPDPERLRAVPLFEELDGDDLSEVASWLTVEEAHVGRHLTTQGASGYAFYVIESGAADVRRDGEAIGELGANDYFGEGAMLGADGRRVADVIVTSRMTFYAMFGTLFRRLESQFPEVAEEIRTTLRGRLASA